MKYNIPFIHGSDKHLRITYTYELIRQPDDDIWDHQEPISDFIRFAYANIRDRYSEQKAIARSLYNPDAEELAGTFISKVESNQDKGEVQLMIGINVEKNDVNSYFSKEHIIHSVHFHSYETDTIIDIFPIGFHVFNYSEFKDTMRNRLVFDLRVLDKNVDASLAYYKDKAIPGLTHYFKHVKEIYKQITDKDSTIDFLEVSDKLDDTITKLYERRIEVPSDPVREIVFLDVIYSGNSKETVEMSVSILVTTEMTSTPELEVTNPEFKSVTVKKDEIIKSYNKVPSIIQTSHEQTEPADVTG